MTGRILAVDDDELCLGLIRRNLEKHGFQISLASDGPSAIQMFHRTQPHLIILDLMLPGMSGWEVCEQIRALSTAPIIMLTALNAKKDIIRGLEAGADDYLVKPFHGDELAARVQAILRRTRAQPPDQESSLRFDNGDLIIDSARHRVFVCGREVELTPTEFDLLFFLAQRPGRLVPANTIFNHVWQFDRESDRGYVKWYVWRIRNKIEEDPRNPRFVCTVRGVGYRFEGQ